MAVVQIPSHVIDVTLPSNKSVLWKNGENLGMFGGHMKITDGIRDPISGMVFSANITSPFNPMNPTDGYSDLKSAQVHLIIQSPPGPITNNFSGAL